MVPHGLNGEVWQLGAYNGGVVAFGGFTSADQHTVPHLAWWKDGRWSPLGRGWHFDADSRDSLEIRGFVERIVQWRDELVLSGYFTLRTAGGDSLWDLAAFDGTRWHAIGGTSVSAQAETLISAAGDTTYDTRSGVAAAAVWHDKLVIAGSFTLDGAQSVSLAAWDGTRWSAMLQPRSYPDIWDLAATSSTLLAFGGGFYDSRNAVWQEGELLITSDSTRSYVLQANAEGRPPVVWHDSLWSVVRDRESSTAGFVTRVTRWTGSAWQSVATLPESLVTAVLPVDEGLLLAGVFRDQNCPSCTPGRGNLLWTPEGTMMVPPHAEQEVAFRAALSVGGATYIAGNGIPTNEDNPEIVQLRANALVPLPRAGDGEGVNAPVIAIAASDARLWIEEASPYALPEWWDGRDWRIPDGRTDKRLLGPNPFLDSLDVLPSIRGAVLPAPDGRVVQGSARPPTYRSSFAQAVWDGGTSSQLPIDGGVAAAAQLASGDIVVGGAFFVPRGNVGVLHRTEVVPLGEGVDAEGGTPWVAALLARHDSLVAGGWFSRAGGRPAQGVALWDGREWKPLGLGVGGDSARVEALCNWEGLIVAAGHFAIADGRAASNIAVWDGNAWMPLGTGLDGTVFAVAVYNGDLVAGGTFTHAGTASTPGLARWRNGRWHSLDDAEAGVTAGEVRALAAWHGSLYVGGVFTSVVAGGHELPSTYIARWRDDGLQGPDVPRVRAPHILAVTSMPTVNVSRLTYDLPQASEVRIALYDVTGREARVLLRASQSPGLHRLEWHANDPNLKTGVYRLVIVTNGGRTSRAIVVVR